MIQLNLLPDIKLEFIKAKRSKRMVLIFAGLAVVVSVALLIIMLSLTSLQKKHISDLNKDIDSSEKTLQDTPDLAKILTIQNQLNKLPSLYAKRPEVSRLFPYLEQTTPVGVGIAHLVVDFSVSSLTIEGTSDSLESVNRYVDTLKFTTFKSTEASAVPETEAVESTDAGTNAFTEVVLSQFGRDATEASYSITLKFDTLIFDSSKVIELIVPETITTRSETELPGNGVFNSETAE
jgi:hypothetical protein